MSTFACTVLLTLLPSLPAVGQQIKDLRLWHSPEKTRVVFDVSAHITYRMFSLDKPLRLVVDIENVEYSKTAPQLDAKNQHISVIRSGQNRKDVVRFVFELKKPLQARDFVLSPNELYGHRLVIDLLEQTAPTENIPKITLQKQDATQPQTKKKLAASNNAHLRVSVDGAISETQPLLIAIDAGHGGEDPGALGFRGSREKKLTLEIANSLKQIIDRDPRMRSFMVRRGDYYINLHKRRQMARLAKADLFISIHADAFRRRSAKGFSVFALSQRGASSAMASALAAKENASDLIGGVSLSDKDDLLAKVLVDLSMTNTISESVNLGGRVLQELDKIGSLHSNKVEQAGFAVLKSADIPSILVETGFITNPTEERNLKSSRYQKKIATAIYTAINNYLQQIPYRSTGHSADPRQTASANGRTNTFNSLVRPSSHKVVGGDSLSKIAERYGTSVTVLKRLNGLKSNTAVLGQRLKLPNGSFTRSTNTKIASVNPAVHVVSRGDSLSKISARYNIVLRSLKRFNNLNKDTVYIGQKIKIPGGTEKAVVQKPRKHKVRSGDTLSEIAQKYHSSVGKIVQANALKSRTIFLGQTLRIP